MDIICCPVCGSPLCLDDKSAHCRNGHCFDRARQGYFNLLGSQQSSEKRHGDDRMMVASRRDFLGRGYYEPLLTAIAGTVCKYAPRRCTLLDVGCGEGYYTEGVLRALAALGCSAQAVAVDISRDAAKSISSRGLPGAVLVASAYSLPILSESCDILIDIFAPVAPEEFRRILKPGGVLVRAVPRERHLYRFKELIYDEPYLNPPVSQELSGFEPLSLLPVDWQLRLDNQRDIDALFKMTPYYYKTSVRDQQKIAALTQLTTELSFAVLADRSA